jgi:hypothetical protein
MSDIKEYMVQYKETSIKLIEALNNEEYDKLNILLDDRQKLIELLKNYNYTSKEFKDICEELDILYIQRELEEKMKNRMNDAKEELKKIHANKSINKNYNKVQYVDSIFFNKKI